MKIEPYQWWGGLRGCVFCGSFFPRPDGLCKVCSQNLWSWAHPLKLYGRDIEGFEVSSLFEWLPGQQQVLSHLIMAIKGGKAKRLWQFYAEEFWRRHLCSEAAMDKQLLLVPCPSQRVEADHAMLFTKALGEASGALICNPLRRPGKSEEQKTKSRSERTTVKLEWAENFSLKEFQALAIGRKVVFVDDVVTTGATARAAWRTLGQPEEFTIWTLAQRSLSCGASLDLV